MATADKVEAANTNAAHEVARQLRDKLAANTGAGQHAKITLSVTIVDGLPRWINCETDERRDLLKAGTR